MTYRFRWVRDWLADVAHAVRVAMLVYRCERYSHTRGDADPNCDLPF